MTVLNYETHVSVTDIPDLLSKIKTFLETTCGWTVNSFQQNKDWEDTGGGVYGFVSGDQTYLDVNAVAYHGSQDLRFKLLYLAEGGDASNDWVRLRHNKSVIDTADSTHPVEQSNDTLYTSNQARYDIGVPPSSIPQVWFFGNNKFFTAAIKCSGDFCQFIGFGCLELFDQTTQNDGGFYGSTVYATGSTRREWYDYAESATIFRNPFDCWDPESTSYRTLAFSGASAHKIAPNAIGNATHSVLDGYYLAQHELLRHNNLVTGIKPLVKLLLYLPISSIPTPIGYLPVFKINYAGFSMGQLLSYGGQEYRVFPNCYQADSIHGIAFRVT